MPEEMRTRVAQDSSVSSCRAGRGEALEYAPPLLQPRRQGHHRLLICQ
jgi:hypothetical protein